MVKNQQASERLTASQHARNQKLGLVMVVLVGSIPAIGTATLLGNTLAGAQVSPSLWPAGMLAACGVVVLALILFAGVKALLAKAVRATGLLTVILLVIAAVFGFGCARWMFNLLLHNDTSASYAAIIAWAYVVLFAVVIRQILKGTPVK